MKKFQNFLLYLVIATVLATGCKKNDSGNITPDTPPKTLQDLNAPASFHWSTEMTVTLKITGLPTVVPVKSTLTVGLPNGTTLFSRLHQMDQNLTIDLSVPSTENQLILKYGSVQYPVSIVNNQASFSFIPVIEE